MKKVIFLLHFLLPLLIYSQAPQIEWQKSYGGTGNELGFTIDNTLDGGFILSGQSTSENGDLTGNYGGKDIWVVKIDADGVIQWQKNYGGSSDDFNSGIKATTDGGYIFVGHTFSNDNDLTANKGFSDAWIVKLNNIGNIDWQKNVGGSSTDIFYSIIESSDGGFLASGITQSNNMDVSGNHGSVDSWVVKFSSTGNIDWQKCYGGTSHEQSRKIIQLQDGNFVFTGYSASNDGDITLPKGDRDYWVVKINSIGEIIWQRNYGGSGYDDSTSLAEANDGTIVISGLSQSNDGDISLAYGYDDYWILKVNNQGDIIWQKNLGGPTVDVGQDIIATEDGGCIVSGWVCSSSGIISTVYNQCDISLSRLGVTGNIIWSKSIGGDAYEQGKGLIKSPNGNILVFGETGSTNGDITFNNGEHDFWLIKFHLENLSNEEFSKVLKIYPNPINSYLNIESSDLNIQKIEIYDLHGRLLISQLDNFALVDFTRLQSNVYILKIFLNDSVYLKKIIKN